MRKYRIIVQIHSIDHGQAETSEVVLGAVEADTIATVAARVSKLGPFLAADVKSHAEVQAPKQEEADLAAAMNLPKPAPSFVQKLAQDIDKGK